MAIVLSRRIRSNRKKRVLVCGDSFFFASSNLRFPGLHWSRRLPDHIEIDNVAVGGASNTMILSQYIENFDMHDVVVFGFTTPWRLEFQAPRAAREENKKVITSCEKKFLNEQQKKLEHDYRSLIHVDSMIVRHCGIAISAIELAKQVSRVCYSLSGSRSWFQDLCNDYPKNQQITQYLRDDMPFNLYDYFNSSEYAPYRHLDGTDSHPPFHVHLPEIQQKFADQVCEFIDKA